MTVVLARVDERLVHGVTVNQWNRELHPKRYMVVDNEISKKGNYENEQACRNRNVNH